MRKVSCVHFLSSNCKSCCTLKQVCVNCFMNSSTRLNNMQNEKLNSNKYFLNKIILKKYLTNNSTLQIKLFQCDPCPRIVLLKTMLPNQRKSYLIKLLQLSSLLKIVRLFFKFNLYLDDLNVWDCLVFHIPMQLFDRHIAKTINNLFCEWIYE